MLPFPAPSLTPSAQRVLIVDDNEDAAESLSLLLQVKGHQVRTVNEGHQALEAVREWRPNVVFLDISLPDLDGFEVARLLRQAYGPSALRLVALTGLDEKSDRERGRDAGFDVFLLKPADPDDLFRAMKAG